MLRKRRKVEEDEEIASQLVSLSGDYAHINNGHRKVIITGQPRTPLKLHTGKNAKVLLSRAFCPGMTGSLPDVSLSKTALPSFSTGSPPTKRSVLERAKGATLQTSLEVSFMECVTGARKCIRISRRELCTDCYTLRARERPPLYRTKQANQSQDTPPVCNLCSNAGTRITPVEVEISVPPGVMNGWKKVLDGQGDISPFGLRGDLIVIFKVESHPFFARKNAYDVSCELPISYAQAALGETFEIPSIDGSRVEVAVPAGTQPFHVVVLKGLGFADFRFPERRGDMHVKILIQIPTSLSDEERSLLERLEELSAENQSST